MMTSMFLTTFRWPTCQLVNIKVQAGIVGGWGRFRDVRLYGHSGTINSPSQNPCRFVQLVTNVSHNLDKKNVVAMEQCV